MASVASQLIEEVTAHAQSDSLEDAREICADGTYFPNNLRTSRIELAVENRCQSQRIPSLIFTARHILTETTNIEQNPFVLDHIPYENIRNAQWCSTCS